MDRTALEVSVTTTLNDPKTAAMIYHEKYAQIAKEHSSAEEED